MKASRWAGCWGSQLEWCHREACVRYRERASVITPGCGTVDGPAPTWRISQHRRKKTSFFLQLSIAFSLFQLFFSPLRLSNRGGETRTRVSHFLCNSVVLKACGGLLCVCCCPGESNPRTCCSLSAWVGAGWRAGEPGAGDAAPTNTWGNWFHLRGRCFQSESAGAETTIGRQPQPLLITFVWNHYYHYD